MNRLATRRSLQALLASLISVVLLVAGCASSDDSSGPSDDTKSGSAESDSAYPVTVDSARGEVTLEEKPTRIVVLSAYYADIVGSLGVAPVAGATEPGQSQEDAFETYPWLEDVEVEEHDPNLLSAEYTASAEAIAVYEPDLIIGTNFQIDDQIYEQVSTIAPTYVPLDDNDVEGTTTGIATLLGDPGLAIDVLAGVEDQFAAARESLAGLHESSFIYAQWLDTQFQVHPKWTFFERLGMTPHPTDEPKAFKLSPENLDYLASDVLIVMAEDDEIATIEADPRWPNLPAVQNDAVVFVEPRMHRSIGLTTPSASAWALSQIVPDLQATGLNQGS